MWWSVLNTQPHINCTLSLPLRNVSRLFMARFNVPVSVDSLLFFKSSARALEAMNFTTHIFFNLVEFFVQKNRA